MSHALTLGLRGAVLAFVAAGFTTAPASAQQQAPEVPEQELRTFAEAYDEIGELRQETQAQLRSADDQGDISRIQQEADREIQAILQSHGLSPERYEEIADVLHAYPEQWERFEAVLAEVDR